jgi:hypothetical protein
MYVLKSKSSVQATAAEGEMGYNARGRLKLMGIQQISTGSKIRRTER